MAAILRSVYTAVDTQAPDRELNHASRLLEGLETSLEARGHLSSSFPPIFHGVGNASGWDLPRRSIGHLGIVVAIFWSPVLGIIIALVGLLAFGGFARGRWY